MIRRRLFFATTIAILATQFMGHAAMAADTSTGGISLSMPPEDIRQKLGDSYKLVQTVEIQRGKVFYFVKGNEAFNLMTLGSQVVYIDHQQFFDPSGEVAATDLKKALEKKYGKPTLSTEAPNDPDEVWIVQKDGSLMSSAMADEAKACADFDLEGPVVKTEGKVTYDFNFPKVPVKDTVAKCGTVITVKTGRLTTNPGLVTHMNVTVFDVGAATAWYSKAMAEYNKHLDDEVDAARKNKPNL